MMRLKCVGDLGQVRVTKLYTFDVEKTNVTFLLKRDQYQWFGVMITG